jgi:hypothetical protein
VPRTTYAGIKDYFDHFLELKPEGKIVESFVSIGENWCKDVGIYEFKKGTDGSIVRARYSFVYIFEDGEWKISHHHSSLMPEELLAKAKPKVKPVEVAPPVVQTPKQVIKKASWA